jgi:hypothetical protein
MLLSCPVSYVKSASGVNNLPIFRISRTCNVPARIRASEGETDLQKRRRRCRRFCKRRCSRVVPNGIPLVSRRVRWGRGLGILDLGLDFETEAGGEESLRVIHRWSCVMFGTGLARR